MPSDSDPDWTSKSRVLVLDLPAQPVGFSRSRVGSLLPGCVFHASRSSASDSERGSPLKSLEELSCHTNQAEMFAAAPARIQTEGANNQAPRGRLLGVASGRGRILACGSGITTGLRHGRPQVALTEILRFVVCVAWIFGGVWPSIEGGSAILQHRSTGITASALRLEC